MFATTDLARGCVVGTMGNPNIERRHRGVPYDSGVGLPKHPGTRQIDVIWDHSVISRKTMPPNSWYRMNHGRGEARNVDLVRSANGLPMWVARRFIRKGEELLWDYNKGQWSPF